MIRIAELFSGIGAQAQSLKNLGVQYESVISEIDKDAIRVYNAIHGKTPCLGDIRSVDVLPGFDVMTYSFPCQDLSMAGLKKGCGRDSETRSSLLWEVSRILSSTMKEGGGEQMPKFLIMENVEAILHKAHFRNFMKWIDTLSNLGYSSTYSILNAKDFGVPQNRRRCFMVSVFGDRKFSFPQIEPKHSKLMDVLESDPATKYYLSEKAIEGYNRHAIRHKDDGFGWKITDTTGVAPCITCKANRHTGTFIQDEQGIRILTPREYWRLQGQPEENFEIAVDLGLSDSKLYALAGNSIAVPCLSYVFNSILSDSTYTQKRLDSWGA